MAKNPSTTLRCTECGWTTPRWVGRCKECQTWGSVAPVEAPATATPVQRPVARALSIAEVPADEAAGVPTGIGELDRVLGEGLVPGAVVLLAGEPGVGKSTLLLEVASHWARAGRRTLYVSAEESAAQVRRRADRTGAITSDLLLAAENDLGTILGHIEDLSPSLLVLDSVQTVSASGTDGIAGGVTQVREVTNALVRVAKRRGMAVLIIGHVTKEGSIAGPRTLEHLVDVVLSFEGDRHAGFRMVRATKNRFGPADEVGCFEMTERGIDEVADPSGLFTSSHARPSAGTCVAATLEGRRPMLTEIQALVAPSALQVPRRVTQGVENGRVAMGLAVLERRARLKLHNQDVYVSTAGGVRVADPAADLAVALAVASASQDWVPRQRIIALGEIGLSGDLRRVAGTPRRLGEAARLGFRAAIVPAGSEKMAKHAGFEVVEVATVADALDALYTRFTEPPNAATDLRAWQRARGQEAAIS
ncbi:DNA repair protein RadA [Nigerium massiliense]|uniref:DNA repair protein RadA n=1 Tax=Nigerium massiliense TaxID=1522317 RepID=UPI000694E708|nr:DNA repair protein RadA [Nigerium massiliense]